MEVIDKDEVGNIADVEILTPNVRTIEEDPVVAWSTTLAPAAVAALEYRITVDPGIDQQWARDVLTAQAAREQAWLAQHPERPAVTVATAI